MRHRNEEDQWINNEDILENERLHEEFNENPKSVINRKRIPGKEGTHKYGDVKYNLKKASQIIGEVK